MTYFTGSDVRLSGAFTDINGVAIDPTTVTLIVQDPAGTETSYTYANSQVTKDSTGNYHKDFTITSPGLWRWRWEGTGACQATDQGEFGVSARNVA